MSGPFLDIEGALDSTSIDTIKQAMIRHHIPEALVDWTENMLAGRRIMVYHGEKMVEGTPDRGCPQGGVLSPLLWCLLVNDLLEDLQREGFHVNGYAADITIVAGGRFLTTLRDLMEHALKITYRWCMTKGLVVNPQKTNIMIFTKKYKRETAEPLRFEGQEIAFTNTVKYLGVLLDPKLNWRQHLIDKREKFYSSMWVCRRAIGKTWGINSKITLWMYKAILLPKLLYAAVVWWPMVSRVEIRNLLQSLQGKYLRAAVESIKTTHTEALEVALRQAPLDLAAIEAAGVTAYRLKCWGQWRNTGLGHT
jgi:hypothetical protein